MKYASYFQVIWQFTTKIKFNIIYGTKLAVMNVHGVHDVRQMDIHTVEPLVPEPSLVEVEIATGKLRSYKSSGTDQIPAEFIKAV